MLDIARAEKKLRQAEFFLGWLEHTSKEELVKCSAYPFVRQTQGSKR